MASPGPRPEPAVQGGAVRAACVEDRLAAREAAVEARIRTLETLLADTLRGSVAAPGAGDAPELPDPDLLRERLAGLRREQYFLRRARQALAAQPGASAPSLAALREGFGRSPAQSASLHGDGRSGA